MQEQSRDESTEAASVLLGLTRHPCYGEQSDYFPTLKNRPKAHRDLLQNYAS